MSSVRFDKIGKSFGALNILHAFDLDIPDHSFLALLGPSGCGKTTVLRMLAGLEMPTAGRILIGDRDVTRLQPRERDVAMVFQSYALYPQMSVAENIGYPLRIRKVGEAARREKIAEVAAILEIEKLLDRKPKQLSGGQRQRVALARAIVRNPAAFLMDEPLSNLDARLRMTMRGEIKRLCQTLAATTLYVTHDQAEALTMADFIAVMNAGALQQLASPAVLYERPANRFVATFVGNPPMSVLPITHTETGIALAGTALELSTSRLDECRRHAVTDIGLRPEDARITEADVPGAIAGEIFVVEPMGNETLVALRTAKGRLTVRAERGFSAVSGNRVGVVFDPANACFFDGRGQTALHRQ